MISRAFVSLVERGKGRKVSVSRLYVVIESSYDGPVFPQEYEGTPEGLDFIKAVMDRFKRGKLIHRRVVIQALLAIRELFASLPSLLRLSLPLNEDGKEPCITVCGDTHGQFFDVCNIFELNGLPSETNPYVFNGDFVDRGSFSFEVVMTFFLLKLVVPNGIYLLRGNHESKNMNKIYGFEGEVKHKYDDTVMTLFTEVFNWIPLAAVVENKVMVVHGGLFKEDNVSLNDIEKIDRNREPPDSGLMSDLSTSHFLLYLNDHLYALTTLKIIVWADPQPFHGRGTSKRGIGLAFGPDITKAFLEYNNLELLVRSHEVKDDGYLVEHDGKCITVFSAPNYCDQMGNKGAFIRFGKDMIPKFTQFTAVVRIH